MSKSKVAVAAEYAALRCASAAVNALPYGCAMRLADALGVVASRVFRFKRRRTLERIRSVFPEKSPRECAFIAERSLCGFLRTAFEMIRASRLSRRWMDSHVVDGLHYKELLEAIVNRGGGAVIMVPHTGNWYMAAWSMARYGLRLFAIAARQRNPLIDAWMHRQYGEVEVLDRDCGNTLLRIRERLHAGRAFAILPDLRVWRRDVEADFLRGKANVSHAGAAFAVDAGVPVVVAAMRRDERGRHVFEHLATLESAGRTAEELTREAMRLLDGFVCRHPEEWYWYNKRWILEPPQEERRGAQS